MSGANVASAFNLNFQSVTPGAYVDSCPTPAVSTSAYILPWSYPMTLAKAQTLPGYMISFSSITDKNLLKGIQSAFVDNSQCSFPVCLTDGAGNTFIIKGGYQAYISVQFSQGQIFTISPVGNFNWLHALVTSNYNNSGGAVTPLQTIVNFLNTRVDTCFWEALEYYSPVAYTSTNDKSITSYRNGKITAQFTGEFSFTTGNSPMVSNMLQAIPYNTFSITEMALSVTAKYGTNSAYVLNGIVYVSATDNSSGLRDGQLVFATDTSLLLSQLEPIANFPSGDYYDVALDLGKQKCNIFLSETSQYGVSQLFCTAQYFANDLLYSNGGNQAINIYIAATGVIA